MLYDFIYDAFCWILFIYKQNQRHITDIKNSTVYI